MTMLIPGTNVSMTGSPPSRGNFVRTGVAFVVGAFQGGRVGAVERIRNHSQLIARLGPRDAVNFLAWDAVDLLLAGGVGEVAVSRVVGPAPVKATGNIFDLAGTTAPADVALTATAQAPGEEGNRLNIVTINPGGAATFRVTHDVLGTLEESPAFTTRADAVAWFAANSSWVTLGLGASDQLPADGQTVSLAGGTDDIAATTNTQFEAAVDAIPETAGPGQILAPGYTSTAAHSKLLTHAAARNRWALLDVADRADVATVKAAIAAQRSANPAAIRCGEMMTSWVDAPGAATLPGTARRVPGSVAQATVFGRNDGKGLSAGIPGAGTLNGGVPWATGVSFPNGVHFTPEEIDELTRAGANTIIEDEDAGVVVWGNRTLVDPSGADGVWRQAHRGRLAMHLVDEGKRLSKPYVHRILAGDRVALSEYGGEVSRLLLDEVEAGTLFVDPANPIPSTAYAVDVITPNTPETMEAGEVNADVVMRMSAAGEQVNLNMVNRPITEAISA